MLQKMPFKENRSRLLSWVLTGLVFLASQELTACNQTDSVAPQDPDAQLALLEPKGGETFHPGDSLTVRWKAIGKGLDEINAVNVELSPDSGKAWVDLKGASISIEDQAWGILRWKIPDSLRRLGRTYPLAGNSKVMVRVMQYQTADTNKIAMIRKPIKITAP